MTAPPPAATPPPEPARFADRFPRCTHGFAITDDHDCGFWRRQSTPAPGVSGETRDRVAAALWALSHSEGAAERCTRHKWAATTWRVMECPLCNADAVLAALAPRPDTATACTCEGRTDPWPGHADSCPQSFTPGPDTGSALPESVTPAQLAGQLGRQGATIARFQEVFDDLRAERDTARRELGEFKTAVERLHRRVPDDEGRPGVFWCSCSGGYLEYDECPTRKLLTTAGSEGKP